MTQGLKRQTGTHPQGSEFFKKIEISGGNCHLERLLGNSIVSSAVKGMKNSGRKGTEGWIQSEESK